MNYKFKKFWRKTGLNEYWGNVLLDLIKEKKPKHFLEIGVFCGVTSRNVCELLNIINKGNFSYIGFDLFGEKVNESLNEAEPEYIKSQKFSNPLKGFYYNYLKKEKKQEQATPVVIKLLHFINRTLTDYDRNMSLIKSIIDDIYDQINKQIEEGYIIKPERDQISFPSGQKYIERKELLWNIIFVLYNINYFLSKNTFIFPPAVFLYTPNLSPTSSLSSPTIS